MQKIGAYQTRHIQLPSATVGIWNWKSVLNDQSHEANLEYESAHALDHEVFHYLWVVVDHELVESVTINITLQLKLLHLDIISLQLH